MTAGEVLTSLTLRLRGPAHSTVLMYQIISHCQRLINLRRGAVLESVPLTTTPEQLFYNLTQFGVLRVEGIRSGSHDLKPTALKNLGYLSRQWGRARSEVVRLWGSVGRRLVFLFPATVSAQSLTVTGVTASADVAVPADVMDLPNEHLNAVLDLAEIVLLLKERRHLSVPVALERLSKELYVQIRDSRAGARSV